MDIEQNLTAIADRYRSQGYQVVARPGPQDLPDFAKTFKMEIVARRPDGSALVAVKPTRRELEADPNVVSYAETTERQPGWRFDLVILGASDELEMSDLGDAHEPSEEDLRHQFETVQRLLNVDAHQSALVAAWSVLEAAMRRKLHAKREDAGWGTSPRTMMNELVSSGVFPISIFRELEGVYQTRSAIVHGFTTPVIETGTVNFLLDVARKLLDESKPIKQSA